MDASLLEFVNATPSGRSNVALSKERLATPAQRSGHLLPLIEAGPFQLQRTSPHFCRSSRSCIASAWALRLDSRTAGVELR